MNIFFAPPPTSLESLDTVREIAFHFVSQGFGYAGLELFMNVLDVQPGLTPEIQANLYADIGRCYVSVGRTQQALPWFLRSLEMEHSMPDVAACRIRMNIAMIYDILNHSDTAHDEVQKLLETKDNLPPQVLSLILMNVSTILFRQGSTSKAIEYTEQALELNDSLDNHSNDMVLYHNLGFYYMEIGELVLAEKHLLKSQSLLAWDVIASAAELSHLYTLKGDMQKSLEFATKAVAGVWLTTMNYEKQELARLCQLLAQVTFYVNEDTLAHRLIEKAQLFYGQLNSWREWQRLDDQMDQWARNRKHATHAVELSIPPSDIRRFLSLLDVVHAQELLGPDYSVLFDVRTRHALALAERLQFSEADMHALAHACRFADFGLTAMELDVIKEPERSPYAWTQYQQHPQLSVDMLAWIELPKSVTTAILQHHERCDGQGYPHGLTDGLITPLASVLAIADAYAHGVVLEQRKHSSVVTDMLAERGTHFNSEFLDEFVRLFEIPHSETE